MSSEAPPNLRLSTVYPVTVIWAEHEAVCGNGWELNDRLIRLWLMRAGMPMVRDRHGAALDASELTFAALSGRYGEGWARWMWERGSPR